MYKPGQMVRYRSEWLATIPHREHLTTLRGTVDGVDSWTGLLKVYFGPGNSVRVEPEMIESV